MTQLLCDNLKAKDASASKKYRKLASCCGPGPGRGVWRRAVLCPKVHLRRLRRLRSAQIAAQDTEHCAMLHPLGAAH